VTNIELQALAHQTFENLMQWRSSLPEEVNIDVATLDNSMVLPQVLMLQ
jgi:hypothetical protein